jgi:hypothetical protein
MNKVTITVVGLVLLLVQACDVDKKVPEKVKTSFELKFPDAKNVEWAMENDMEWEVEFTMNGVDYSSNFTVVGEWTETEFEMKITELPEVVQTVINSDYSDYNIEGIESSETKEGVVYEIALEKEDINVELSISEKGVLLNKVTVKENEVDETD